MKAALKIRSRIYQIKEHILLIAHNANYDCRFLLRSLTKDRPPIKGGRALSCTTVYYRVGHKKQPIIIIIEDSFKIINMPLKNFGKSFKLDVEKEFMPYQLYTQETSKRFMYRHAVQSHIFRMIMYPNF